MVTAFFIYGDIIKNQYPNFEMYAHWSCDHADDSTNHHYILQILTSAMCGYWDLGGYNPSISSKVTGGMERGKLH